MKREQIMATIQSLSHSQGMYGRLLANIQELDAEEYDKLMTALEAENFNDPVDLVMYIEG